MVTVCGNTLQAAVPAAEMGGAWGAHVPRFQDDAVPPGAISLSAAMGPSSTTNTGSHQMKQVEGATRLENSHGPQFAAIVTANPKNQCTAQKH
jgi:hypothetical protein